MPTHSSSLQEFTVRLDLAKQCHLPENEGFMETFWFCQVYNRFSPLCRDRSGGEAASLREWRLPHTQAKQPRTGCREGPGLCPGVFWGPDGASMQQRSPCHARKAAERCPCLSCAQAVRLMLMYNFSLRSWGCAEHVCCSLGSGLPCECGIPSRKSDCIRPVQQKDVPLVLHKHTFSSDVLKRILISIFVARHLHVFCASKTKANPFPLPGTQCSPALCVHSSFFPLPATVAQQFFRFLNLLSKRPN